ncbi:hypothetical protein [Gimesia alba]|uniref:hypothetical protein n=1 Tax=Gimesia alba TaxID=2527973 RepID=UPI0011A39333|nr:hypothetical protein [Gimesia alba]
MSQFYTPVNNNAQKCVTRQWSLIDHGGRSATGLSQDRAIRFFFAGSYALLRTMLCRNFAPLFAQDGL